MPFADRLTTYASLVDVFDRYHELQLYYIHVRVVGDEERVKLERNL